MISVWTLTLWLPGRGVRTIGRLFFRRNLRLPVPPVFRGKGICHDAFSRCTNSTAGIRDFLSYLYYDLMRTFFGGDSLTYDAYAGAVIADHWTGVGR